jgi:hypothetical protein
MAKEGTWEGTFEWDGYEVGGLTSVQFGSTRDIKDQTCMGASVTTRDRMAGLKDGSLTVSGFFEPDSEGQAELRIDFMINPQVAKTANVGIGGTTAGWGMTGLVESISITGDVGDVVKFSATIKCDNVAPAAASF